MRHADWKESPARPGQGWAGSAVRGGAAWAVAVPPGPHINSAIDELATARVDENLMAMSSQCGGIQFYRRQDITFGCEVGHGRFRIRPGGRTLGDLAEIRTAP